MNNARDRLNKRGQPPPVANLPEASFKETPGYTKPLIDDSDATLVKKVEVLKRNYPDEFNKYNPVTDRVDPNNPRDDGWTEFKEAEILARKEVLKCVETLKVVRDTAPIKRDRLRAASAIIDFAEGKQMKEEAKPQAKYNVNLLIAVLTGNK